jgi:hypothetical protein
VRLPSDPISLVAADIHLGFWPAGFTGGWLKSIIQNMCQLGAAQKTKHFQSFDGAATHQLD